jgi:hypothetical protein
MKRLGNAAIHPNEGDISKQQTFNRDLLRQVTALFSALLEEAYEVSHRRAAQIEALKEAAASIEKPTYGTRHR